MAEAVYTGPAKLKKMPGFTSGRELLYIFTRQLSVSAYHRKAASYDDIAFTLLLQAFGRFVLEASPWVLRF